MGLVRKVLLAILVQGPLLIVASGSATAQEPAGSAAYAAGRAHYEAAEYDQAAASLEQAVTEDPGNSKYHHLLGRSYARMAERSTWYGALPLARRALKQFREAVKLDPRNRDAWEDLGKYYRRAPAFLGGSERKAREIDARLAAQNR